MTMSVLDYLNTPIGGRGGRYPVVPRIVCADGTALSVQASDRHYAKKDESTGKWASVEVACLENAPDHWPSNNEYIHQGYEVHDGHGWVIGDDFSFMVHMYITLEEVMAFIESHGGVAEVQPLSRGWIQYVENRMSGRVSA